MLPTEFSETQFLLQNNAQWTNDNYRGTKMDKNNKILIIFQQCVVSSVGDE